jgi:iron(III) transport system substrate-binding protein
MKARRHATLVRMLAVLVPLAILSWPGLGAAQDAPILQKLSGAERDRVQKLIEAAKKEGEVNLLNPIFSDHTGQLFEQGFRDLYGLGPGFKFVNTRKGTGAVVATVTQEIRAGKFTADLVVVNNPEFYFSVAQAGQFLEYNSPYWKPYEEVVKRAGEAYDPPRFVTPFAYTFQPVWNRKCPGFAELKIASYQDFLDPKLRGKTIMADLPKSTTYTATWISLGQKMDVPGFFKKFKEISDPIVMFRTEPKMERVISCERPLDMWNLAGRAYQNWLKDKSLNLGVAVFKEGHLMLGNQMAILKGAPHPSAAMLFYDYLLRPEGQTEIVRGEAIHAYLPGLAMPAEVKDWITPIDQMPLLTVDWRKVDKAAMEKARADWAKIFQQ